MSLQSLKANIFMKVLQKKSTVSVNIGSGNGLVPEISDNGLVPSDIKPFPESLLTQISVAIWRH